MSEHQLQKSVYRLMLFTACLLSLVLSGSWLMAMQNLRALGNESDDRAQARQVDPKRADQGDKYTESRRVEVSDLRAASGAADSADASSQSVSQGADGRGEYPNAPMASGARLPGGAEIDGQVAPEPHQVALEQRQVTPEPRPIAPEPRQVASEPRAIAPEPQQVVPELHQVAREPRQIAPEPRQVAREPSQIVPPRPLPNKAPQPYYPLDAYRLRKEGSVGLRVWVDAKGVPKRVLVTRSSKVPELDRAAAQAIYDWRFRPATADGRPTAGQTKVTIDFKMNR